MPNLKPKIDGQNEKILKNTPPPKSKICKCLKKEDYPMSEACFTENVWYFARVRCDDEI